MTEYMLTTTDNPFDPFTQYEGWYSWDTTHGYHTLSLLARMCWTSDELSEADQDLAIDQAMDDIIAADVFGVYKKVSSNVNSEEPITA